MIPVLYERSMDNEPKMPTICLASVEAKIIRERDDLVAERSRLVQERQEVLVRLRQADRKLADCRAAARFFGLTINFPDDESEHIERIERERALSERERELTRRILTHRAEIALKNQPAIGKMAASEGADTFSATARLSRQGVEPEPIKTRIASEDRRPSRQTLRDVILDRLMAAGPEGSKAAPIREFYERTFGKIIHEKTVGMTLYRLQNDGLVRHEGHTWYLAPPKAETGNPGAETPGPINPET